MQRHVRGGDAQRLAPNAFERRTRTLRPPALRCTTWRTVTFSSERPPVSAESAAIGGAAQLATHEGAPDSASVRLYDGLTGAGERQRENGSNGLHGPSELRRVTRTSRKRDTEPPDS